MFIHSRSAMVIAILTASVCTLAPAAPPKAATKTRIKTKKMGDPEINALIALSDLKEALEGGRAEARKFWLDYTKNLSPSPKCDPILEAEYEDPEFKAIKVYSEQFNPEAIPEDFIAQLKTRVTRMATASKARSDAFGAALKIHRKEMEGLPKGSREGMEKALTVIQDITGGIYALCKQVSSEKCAKGLQDAQD